MLQQRRTAAAQTACRMIQKDSDLVPSLTPQCKPLALWFHVLQQGMLQQRCMATAPFVYQDVMEMGPSTTEYRKLPGDYVQTSIVNGKTILQVWWWWGGGGVGGGGGGVGWGGIIVFVKYFTSISKPAPLWRDPASQASSHCQLLRTHHVLFVSQGAHVLPNETKLSSVFNFCTGPMVSHSHQVASKVCALLVQVTQCF